MDDLHPRLRAISDLDIADTREHAGRHEYDGVIQDLSPGGVRSALSRLAAAARDHPLADPHDEAHAAAQTAAIATSFGAVQAHRRSPILHLEAMDLSCYDRPYAPAGERLAAARRQLAAWPDAVAAAIAALDEVSPAAAAALLPQVRGLAQGIPAGIGGPERERGLAALRRLVAHLERAAAAPSGAPFALGAGLLAALLSSAGAMPADLGALARAADAERDRLRERLAADCARLGARAGAGGRAREPREVVRELTREHPGAGQLLAAAQYWADESIAFTRRRGLVPYADGSCQVAAAPQTRRWAAGAVCPAAPGEPDGPTMFYVSPPDPAWPAAEAEEWLTAFSAVTLPALAVHLVAPGHFARARALRRAASQTRRTLLSWPAVVGWAHYAEELCVEEGFRREDPRFAIGVWLAALVRQARLACAIGVHTEAMSLAEAAQRFAADTHLTGRGIASEVNRLTWDPLSGRYTWGKLEILKLRDQARQRWGAAFTLRRFHAAVLALGSPPLGLLPRALAEG